MKTIVHVDMDSFFASVEQRDNPELRGKPVIVGGHRDSRRGVVATCSYEARKYGVHSAMPIVRAVQLCPQGIFLPSSHAKYAEVSQQIRQVLREFSPLVENVSIDEAFLDMTGCEHSYASLTEMGRYLKKRIWEAVSLTASVGIGPNKLVAKLASDYNKPDGLVVVAPEEVEDWLAPMPVDKIWGIGQKTTQALAQMQIRTIADLRRCSREFLLRRFGKQGLQLYQLARGIDTRKVTPESPTKSVGKETTFEYDVANPRVLKAVLADLVAQVGFRLRRYNLWGKTVTLKLRFSDFTTLTRSQSVTEPLHDDDGIFNIAYPLLQRNLNNRPLRLLGVYVSHLTSSPQASLFADPRQEKLTNAIDAINRKYHKPVIRKGRQLRDGS